MNWRTTACGLLALVGCAGLFTKVIDGQTFLGILGLLVAVLGWNATDKQNKPGE
jgi:hypothetical protein